MNPAASHTHFTSHVRELRIDKILLLGAFALAFAGAVFVYERFSPTHPGITNRGEACHTQENCIREVVFLYEMQHSEGGDASTLFFLAVEEGRDPDTELLTRLVSHPFYVEPFSQAVRGEKLILNKTAGEPGIVVRLGRVNWVGADAVTIGLSTYSGSDVREYVYHLAKTDNRWTVTNREWILES